MLYYVVMARYDRVNTTSDEKSYGEAKLRGPTVPSSVRLFLGADGYNSSAHKARCVALFRRPETEDFQHIYYTVYQAFMYTVELSTRNCCTTIRTVASMLMRRGTASLLPRAFSSGFMYDDAFDTFYGSHSLRRAHAVDWSKHQDRAKPHRRPLNRPCHQAIKFPCLNISRYEFVTAPLTSTTGPALQRPPVPVSKTKEAKSQRSQKNNNE